MTNLHEISRGSSALDTNPWQPTQAPVWSDISWQKITRSTFGRPLAEVVKPRDTSKPRTTHSQQQNQTDNLSYATQETTHPSRGYPNQPPKTQPQRQTPGPNPHSPPPTHIPAAEAVRTTTRIPPTSAPKSHHLKQQPAQP